MKRDVGTLLATEVAARHYNGPWSVWSYAGWRCHAILRQMFLKTTKNERQELGKNIRIWQDVMGNSEVDPGVHEHWTLLFVM